MTPEAKLTQPARVAATRVKRAADIPLTDGEHALFVDAAAFDLRAELAETTGCRDRPEHPH